MIPYTLATENKEPQRYLAKPSAITQKKRKAGKITSHRPTNQHRTEIPHASKHGQGILRKHGNPSIHENN